LGIRETSVAVQMKKRGSIRLKKPGLSPLGIIGGEEAVGKTN